MYQYPYGNAQQLNLDWILNKIQELESGGGGEVDLEEVANALVSASYDTGHSYRKYDYAFYNNKLYRCKNDTTGAWNPSDWDEAPIGDDVSILIRLINTAVITDVKFDTSDTNGKLQQKYGASYHDVVEVDYTPVQNSKRPLSSNAGYDLNTALTSHFPNDWIADLNDLPHNTVVMGKFNNLTLNIPIASTGSVWHFSTSANSAVQIIEYVTTNGIWYRCKESGTWRAWQRIDNEVLTVSTAFAIPASGSSTTKSIEGLSADYILVAWNFSTSPENSPPVDLSWTTASGSFTITNNGGTTSETIKPIFVRPIEK